MGIKIKTISEIAKKGLAEFFGTGFLVFTIVASKDLTAIAAGFNLAFSIWVIGPVSGGHVNPIVTFMMVLQKKMSLLLGMIYIISQIIGSIVASKIAMAIIPQEILTDVQGMATVNLIGKSDLLAVFMVEAAAAFYFAMVILSVTDAFRNENESWKGSAPALAALFIGLSTIPATSICNSISSGSLNPARSIGPAIANNVYKDQWIFFIAPFIGAFFALIFYSLICDDHMSKKRIIEYVTCSNLSVPPKGASSNLDEMDSPEDTQREAINA